MLSLGLKWRFRHITVKVAIHLSMAKNLAEYKSCWLTPCTCKSISIQTRHVNIFFSKCS